MKVGIIGPGAMGCLLAGLIARSGVQAILLDYRKERTDHINRQGLVIEGIQGQFRVQVPATLNPEDLSGSALILICVKAYDTRSAAREIQKITPTPYVLTLQNGVGNVETLGEYLPKDRILAGITSHGATYLGPGQVRHAGKGDTFIGHGFPGAEGQATGDSELLLAKGVLDSAGVETQLVPKIDNLIWSKLLVNVGINALTALTRLPNGKLINFPGTLEILEGAVAEAIRVGENKGITFIYADPLAQVKKVCQLTGSNISSMLQDILKKKRTEIDFINGTIMEEGRRLNLPVPYNRVLTLLVRTLESSYGQTASLPG